MIVIHNDWTIGETDTLKNGSALGWPIGKIADAVNRSIADCQRKRDRLVDQGILIPNGERYVIK